MSSQDRTAQHALTAVLRGGPAPSTPTAEPRPGFVDLVPQLATSTHQQAVTTALAGTPLRVDVGSEGGTFLAGLLAALAAAGRAVTLVPGPATDPAREELRAVGLGHLLADTEEDPTRRGAGLPPADPARWSALLRDLTARDRAWFGSEGGGEGTASRFDALVALAALRAEHLHPPLLPQAAGWTPADRERVTTLLVNAPRTGDDALRGHSDDEISTVADTLTTLPDALDRLADLTARLTRETNWRTAQTLTDLDAVDPVLGTVDRALRTYVPAALHTDLDAARAILARQPRSLLSAEERERRRELKRLAALRHDGATFGPADVETLQAVQTTWATHADGAPRAWTGRTELQQTLQAARDGLATVAPLFPHETDATDVAALSVLAQRLRDAATAVTRRKDRAAITAEGLDDLLDAVPSGSRTEEIARLVDGTHWRALTEGTATAAAGDDLVRDFTRLDDLRRARAARELQLALAGARATPVQLDGATPHDPTDVLVVDGADRLDPATVAARGENAALTILLGTPGHDGSAWAAAGPAVATVALTHPAKPAELTATVADALRSAGLPVVEGTDSVSGGDLQIGELLVDLDATHGTLPVQDREVARAARLRRDPRPRHVVRSADWFTDHRKATRAVVDAYEALTPAAPETPEPVVQTPVENFPPGMGTAEAAQTAVAEFLAALAGGNPNIDQTPAATLDAAIALTYADLGLRAGEKELLDAAMDRLTYRRRGTKVLRAFKESLQRSQKKMRGAGAKLP